MRRGTDHRIRFILAGRKRASHINNVASSHWLTSRTEMAAINHHHSEMFRGISPLSHYFNSYPGLIVLSLHILKTTWGGGGGWM